MQEIISKTVDPDVPLQGQEFYELRSFEEANRQGTRHGVWQAHATWIGTNQERRLALFEKGFIYSDMDR